MTENKETLQMVDMLTTVAKLPEPMQALAMGYAKGLADAEKLHRQEEPNPKKTA